MTKYVEIRQAGRRIEVPEGGTILEAALADGIAYPHGCHSGRCGSCKSRLVSGEVDLLDHSRFALSEEEKAQGLILACRAIPRTDAIVAWLGSDEETASHPRRRLNCRVKAIKDATHDIKHIRLTIVEPMSLGRHRWSKRLCRSLRNAGCGAKTCMPTCFLRPEKHRRLRPRKPA